MGVVLLIVLTLVVLGGIWAMAHNSPQQEINRREQRKVQMRAQGIRGRLDAVIDLEEQPKRRWSTRILRRRR